MKQNINCYLTKEKVQDESILMILKLLLNTQMTWMIFIKILKNTIQIKYKKKLIASDDMIPDMLSNKKLNPIVIQLFLRGRNLNISLVFITQSYFKVPKDVRLNTTHFFIMKITNKRELQQIAYNHSSDIDFKDFMNLYKNVLKNHILVSHSCNLLLYHIILHVSERMF